LPKSNYILALAAVSAALVVSAPAGLVVSAGAGGGVVVSTGATTVVSLVSVFSPELLQAVKATAMIAIAKNFFICAIFLIFYEIFHP
jgi:hypothetical protein